MWAVGCEHTVVVGEVRPWPGHPGGQPRQKIQRLAHNLCGAVVVRARVKNQAAWNRSTRRARVRWGTDGQAQLREYLGLSWESVYFEFLLTALTQKHECELLLMSECANVRKTGCGRTR